MSESNLKQGSSSRKSRFFVITTKSPFTGNIFTTSQAPQLRQMPLYFDNNLPAIELQFEDKDNK